MPFPAELTNAIDGVTEIVAAHLNNLEAKVGIDNSAAPTSLDYLLKNPASINPGHRHSKLWAADGSPEAVTVDAAGNVGIGTLNPSVTLDIEGNLDVGGEGAARLFRVFGDQHFQAVDVNPRYMRFVTSGGTSEYAFRYQPSANLFSIYEYRETNSNVLNLKDGKIGIGTVSSNKKLDVSGYLRGVGLFNTLNSAPADGDLAAGECALWFDKTDGASKLMIKAKQNDGSVKTGSVSLS
ncbi:MAG: hypothetical protein ACOZF2_00110 [Thermodesulfobacteriota bacterium]